MNNEKVKGAAFCSPTNLPIKCLLSHAGSSWWGRNCAWRGDGVQPALSSITEEPACASVLPGASLPSGIQLCSAMESTGKRFGVYSRARRKSEYFSPSLPCVGNILGTCRHVACHGSSHPAAIWQGETRRVCKSTSYL